MWAMTNRHKGIAKLLLDHGASPEVKSLSGRTAFDFIAPNSEISEYLHESGYNIGNAGVGDDFYDTGLAQGRFEEEMAETEMKRRMMMESAINLEVDLSSLGLDEQPEVILCARTRGGGDANLRSRQRSWKKKGKNSFGTNVLMTRCLSFRRVNLGGYWISSSQI
jgi:ankyrin repeat protein